MSPGIDRKAVLVGALAGLSVAVPAIVAFTVVDAVAELDPESDAVFPFFALVLVGWMVAGFAAGRRQTTAPLTHGALAAAAGYAVVLVVRLVAAAVGGDELPLVEFAFNALLAASAGVLGGIVATRRPAARRRGA